MIYVYVCVCFIRGKNVFVEKIKCSIHLQQSKGDKDQIQKCSFTFITFHPKGKTRDELKLRENFEKREREREREREKRKKRRGVFQVETPQERSSRYKTMQKSHKSLSFFCVCVFVF